ncbi:MAG TPA: TetR/AcrR family transcriptional regulator [Acidimicrobiia bacterium]|nr:TetR/AcrR family transcriptional regulator [Acidimicrobiia bacterium]
MQNTVPAGSVMSVEHQLAEHALAGRKEAYAAEVRKLIDAAFRVMLERGDIDPSVRDIVTESGLSNQAFYRHFRSKDELLVAVLTDGQRRLVDHLEGRVASTADPAEQLRRWIAGVLAQAQNTKAADATRPFVINRARLADRYPTEVAASRAQLLTTLLPTVRALGGNEHDAECIHDLAMQRMDDALVHRRPPDRKAIEQLYQFCLGGIRRGA